MLLVVLGVSSSLLFVVVLLSLSSSLVGIVAALDDEFALNCCRLPPLPPLLSIHPVSIDHRLVVKPESGRRHQFLFVSFLLYDEEQFDPIDNDDDSDDAGGYRNDRYCALLLHPITDRWFRICRP